MGDDESNFQPSKKRAAGVQISRENPGLDDDETSGPETGSFKRASDEVLASRRIVKVRRHQTSSTPSAPAPSSNPFAAIRLVSPLSSAAPEKVEESGGVGKEIEPTDKNDDQSKNKVDEPKDELKVGEEETDVKEESATQPENEVDELTAEPNAEKDSADAEGKPNQINSAEESAQQSKNEVDELTAEPNAEKYSADEVGKPNQTNSADVNAQEGDNSGGEAQITGTNNSELEVKKYAEGEKTEEKDNGDVNDDKGTETSPFGSFRQLSSSQNAFIGLTGTGFSSSTFSFGSIPKDGSSLGSSSLPSFSFGASNNGSSIFGTSGPTSNQKSGGNAFPSMQEVPVETGEENERVVFTADSVLYEYIDGGWKERGKGELKVNASTTEVGKARLIMRARGNYRLILNAGLFPDMKLTNMDKKGVTFACVNTAGEGKERLSTFALKFKDVSVVEEFRASVTEHKDKTVVPLKTPENSL